jgi:nucleoside 2-deoxyribosyltransferase
MASSICPVCKTPNTSSAIHPQGKDLSVYYCKRCGTYEVSGTLEVMLSSKPANYKLSYALRQRFENGIKNSLVSTNYIDIQNSVKYPKTIIERVDKILNYMYDNYDKIKGGFTEDTIDNHQFSLFGIDDQGMLKRIIDYALEKELIKISKITDDVAFFELAADGIDKVEDLQKNISYEGKVFVAMWFDDKMKPVYINTIKEAVISFGYKPLRIDEKEYNNKIDDQILKEIDESDFMIADFTGHRGGVYFEAGYAIGKGKEVIFTCRADDSKEVHFDTNHYNYIFWKDEEDLRVRLEKRIKECFY